MVQAPAAAGVGWPMTWREFLDLPDNLRAEYVDGKALVNPPPSYPHQTTCLRLRDLLVGRLGTQVIIALAVGWQVFQEARHLRIPDLMLLEAEPDGPVVTTPPPVVVEVLSTNRSEDLVRKSTEYLEAGVGQYWIVDPRDRVIDVYERGRAGWDHLAQLTDAEPETTFVTPFGPVTLSLPEVLGPAS